LFADARRADGLPPSPAATKGGFSKGVQECSKQGACGLWVPGGGGWGPCAAGSGQASLARVPGTRHDLIFLRGRRSQCQAESFGSRLIPNPKPKIPNPQTRDPNREDAQYKALDTKPETPIDKVPGTVLRAEANCKPQTLNFSKTLDPGRRSLESRNLNLYP